MEDGHAYRIVDPHPSGPMDKACPAEGSTTGTSFWAGGNNEFISAAAIVTLVKTLALALIAARPIKAEVPAAPYPPILTIRPITVLCDRIADAVAGVSQIIP
jgi:hypothetical protein